MSRVHDPWRSWYLLDSERCCSSNQTRTSLESVLKMLRSHDGDGPTGTRVSFGGASQISILPVLQSSSRLFSVLCRILLVLAQRSHRWGFHRGEIHRELCVTEGNASCCGPTKQNQQTCGPWWQVTCGGDSTLRRWTELQCGAAMLRTSFHRGHASSSHSVCTGTSAMFQSCAQ